MALKIGNRVTVKPGVSNCIDEGSIAHSKTLAANAGKKPDSPEAMEGVSRERFVGKRGEVIQIGADGPCTCPSGCQDMVLVDSQIVNGKPVGPVEMREWFLESELELG